MVACRIHGGWRMNVLVQAKLDLPRGKTKSRSLQAGVRLNWSLVLALAANTAFWLAVILAVRSF